jgi:hypothetical protein
MPFVTAAMIAAVVGRYRLTETPLVVSEYDGVTAPPTLYDQRLFDELLEMASEGCGKQVLKKHRAEAVRIPWPALALTDLDVPEDYDLAAHAMAAAQWDRSQRGGTKGGARSGAGSSPPPPAPREDPEPRSGGRRHGAGTVAVHDREDCDTRDLDDEPTGRGPRLAVGDAERPPESRRVGQARR